MVLGGLKEGVTPLEMAYAYSTIANEGERISSSFAPDAGPIGFDAVKGRALDEKNKVTRVRVFPQEVGELAKEMLHLVVTSGTAKAAQVGDEYIWGKTGTTENYGDAWFAGGNDDMTVAIWVGYADKVQPMEYEHAGGPVAGGTFPAEIFHDFMASWLELREARRAARGGDEEDSTDGTAVPAQPVDPNALPEGEQPTETAPNDQGEGGNGQDQPDPTPAPEAPDEAPGQEAPAPVEPAPTPTEPPSGGGGTGGGVTPNATTG
jgi:penicillin-binding protein 1A